MVRICTIPHDILTATMHKAILRAFFSLLILAIVLAALFALPSTNISYARPMATATAIRTAHATSSPRAANATLTPAATPVDRSQPGSTDGLVLMSFAIALIIVIPLLFQRGLWGK